MTDSNKPNGPKGPMAGSMQGATPLKKKHSLNRETQIKSGTQLQKMYNTYLNEGTPDRFRHLMHQLESGTAPGFQGDESYAGAKDAPDSKGS